MSIESLSEGVLGLAEQINARGVEPAEDPSLDRIPLGTDPLVHQLVYSSMLWESSHDNAGRCMEAVRESVVDFNELRVCSPAELQAMLPRDCPAKEERSARLLAAMNDVFEREHGLNLESVAAMPKRDARQYLDTLEGMTPFVAARVVLVSLGGHAFPADGRIAGLLLDAGLITPEESEPATLCARLERAVRAADAPRVYALLESAAADAPKRRRKRPRAKAGVPAERQADPDTTGGTK